MECEPDSTLPFLDGGIIDWKGTKFVHGQMKNEPIGVILTCPDRHNWSNKSLVFQFMSQGYIKNASVRGFFQDWIRGDPTQEEFDEVLNIILSLVGDQLCVLLLKIESL